MNSILYERIRRQGRLQLCLHRRVRRMLRWRRWGKSIVLWRKSELLFGWGVCGSYVMKLWKFRIMVQSLRFMGNVELTELFANHTFVGIVDGWRRLAAIQHGVKLYLVDYGAVWYYLPNLDIDKSYEFFYQVGLSEFGNFGTIEIQDGLDLRELLAISMDKDD